MGAEEDLVWIIYTSITSLQLSVFECVNHILVYRLKVLITLKAPEFAIMVHVQCLTIE